MHRHTFRFGRSLIPLLILAAPAAGQDPRLGQRLDSATAAAVAALLDSARRTDLPVEPLLDRALEGASKRAPGERILAAVRLRLGELVVARNALGPGADPAELDVAAAALHVGAMPADLSRLRTARPDDRLVVPLAVLTDLVARGVPADTATGLVLALASAPDETLLAFRRDVERDIALGAPPLTAATVRAGLPIRDATSTLGQGPRRPPGRVKP